MLKPINAPSVDQFKGGITPQDEDAVTHIFQVLHGYYGNLFLSRYQSGHLDKKKEDTGIVNARRMWAFGVREFDGDTIKSALRQCQARHEEFPPNLPQFISLCKACKPREVMTQSKVMLTMGSEIRSQYARQARAIILKHAEREQAVRTGARELTPDLGGLKQAIASAVAAAGGDEAATLLRLDRDIPTVGA